MTRKLNEKPIVHSMSDTDFVLGCFGNTLGRMSKPDLRSALNNDDNQVLNDLAFYIDVNTASASGSTRVDVGGNMNMRQLWEDSVVTALMNKDGYYCELNPKDGRYTSEGEAVIDLTTGAVVSKFAHCDFMNIAPMTYGRIQTITVGSVTRNRLWLSLVPLPKGFIIPQIVVGRFKASLVSGAMRSLPNYVPDASKTINAFWNQAQVRSKNHGLANLDFRNFLLWHMMSKYAWRDCQNCKGSDGTLVWGVGLDGTESTGSGESVSGVGFTRQKNIKTGHALSLGKADGKVAVTDSISNTVHGVNVCGFENPWGQYFEMVQGLCSVGTDVYNWRSNVMPTGTPTAATFEHIDHVLLQRPTSAVWGMNMIASHDGQGCYMIPKESVSGISYGDYFSYAAAGQLWLFGGDSSYGSACGLAYSGSGSAWSYADSHISVRLAYYGDVTKVSPTRLAELV